MTLTADDLNRATLARQMLLAREDVPVEDAVRRVLALQAQDAAGPFVALANRVAAFDPAAVDAAYAAARLVRSTLLRITIHTVHADDHPTLHAAVLPTLRASCLNDPRFTVSGLTPADADDVVAGLRALTAVPRTQDEIDAWLRERVGPDAAPAVWWAVRRFARLRHVPDGSTWAFARRRTYAATGDDAEPDRTPALAAYALRWFAAFGPGTVADVAQAAMVRRGDVRAALDAVPGALVEVTGPDGRPLLDLPDAPRPDGRTPAPPRLLGMWDSVLLAHHDRSRVVPPQHRAHVTRRNGDVLPTLLVDGRVAGVWRLVDDGVEATALDPLPDDAWDGLAEEAARLLAWAAPRDPALYARHTHWWASLPADGQRRVLPG